LGVFHLEKYKMLIIPAKLLISAEKTKNGSGFMKKFGDAMMRK
jgi:hypothetical protein